jgi:DNA-binding NarL/FixJ family response regulator
MKFLVIEDDAVLREALCDALRELQRGAIIYEASDRSEATRIVESHAEINLIWLDLELPGTDGFELVHELLMRDPAVALVVASARQDRASILRALHLGAGGFIPKSASLKVILSALQLIFNGGIYVPPQALGPPSQFNPSAATAARYVGFYPSATGD